MEESPKSLHINLEKARKGLFKSMRVHRFMDYIGNTEPVYIHAYPPQESQNVKGFEFPTATYYVDGENSRKIKALSVFLVEKILNNYKKLGIGKLVIDFENNKENISFCVPTEINNLATYFEIKDRELIREGPLSLSYEEY